MTAVASELERKYERIGFPHLVLLVNPRTWCIYRQVFATEQCPQTLSTSLLLAWDD